ncbi:sigma factor-like helix-turn-helix DNA-binding protein [Streptomyces sp. NPDC056069]|uniref:sigma factor-like helix-turn-helix DNA-binding protein n=1 Tax=Streptomyces sp. NPDC056069 TaxID=3345702 RepID=UPI0035DF894B
MLTVSVEEHRTRLRAVAFRLLGSYDEADAALMAAGSRLTGSEADLDALARVCLDLLRSREARREPGDRTNRPPGPEDPRGPEEAVLDTMPPSERLAFVLHDAFGVPNEEIAPVVDLTPAATRQLVARARRRVQGTEEMPEPDPARQQEAVAAFLEAARADDTEALLALMDPDVVLRADAEAVRTGTEPAHGAYAVARSLAGRTREARLALVDGAAGLVRSAPDGGPEAVFAFTVLDGRITAVDVLAARDTLDALALTGPA